MDRHWVYRWTDGPIDRGTDRLTGKKTDGWKDGQKLAQGQKDGMDGQTDKWREDRQMDKSTEG